MTTVRVEIGKAPEAIKEAYGRTCQMLVDRVYADPRHVPFGGTYTWMFMEHLLKFYEELGLTFEPYYRGDDPSGCQGLVWQYSHIVFPNEDAILQYVLSI